MRYALRLFVPVALIAVLLLSACDTSSSTQDQPDLNVSVQAAQSDTMAVQGDTIIFQPVDHEKGPEQFLSKITAEARQGQIRVSKGYFHPFFLDQGLRRDIVRDGRRIEVRLWATSGGDEHPSMPPPPLLYEAQVVDLAAGTYNLVVRHQYDASRDPEPHDAWVTVLEQEVQVP